MNRKKILIIGMPRSGTTWLAKIFDSHPNTFYLHEPDSEFKLTETPVIIVDDEKDEYLKNISNFNDVLLQFITLKTIGKTPFFNKEYQNIFVNSFFKYKIFLYKVLQKIGLPLKIQHSIGSNKQATIVWKSIESVGRINAFMEEDNSLKVVAIIRHPCGQIASVIKGEGKDIFSSSTLTSEDYPIFNQLLKTDWAKKLSLTEDKFKNMLPIERLAYRWGLFNQKLYDDINSSPTQGVIVRYEDLCLTTQNEAQKMIEFSELSWGTDTQEFVSSSINTEQSAYYSVYKNPEKAMQSWKKSISEEHVLIIKEIVKKFPVGNLFFNE